MSNLRGASPVGRDGECRSYMAQTVNKRGSGLAMPGRWEVLSAEGNNE